MRTRARDSRRSTTSVWRRRCRRRPGRTTARTGCRSTPSSSSTTRRRSGSTPAGPAGSATWRRTNVRRWSVVLGRRSRIASRAGRRFVDATSPDDAAEFPSPQVRPTPSRAAGGTRRSGAARAGPRRAVPRREVDRLRQGLQRLVRSDAADGKETQLSHDGREGLAYGRLEWSPDSYGPGRLPHRAGRREGGLPDRVVAPRRRPGAVLHADPTRCRATSSTAYELNLFDVADQQADQAGGRSHRHEPGDGTAAASPLEPGRPPLHLREGRPRPPALPAHRGRCPHRRSRATSSTRSPTRSSGPPTRENLSTRPRQLARRSPTRSSTSPSATAGGTCT